MGSQRNSKRARCHRALCWVWVLTAGAGLSSADIVSASPARPSILDVQWNYDPLPPLPPPTPVDPAGPLPPRVYPPVYSPQQTNSPGSEPWPYDDAEIRRNVQNALASDSFLHRSPIRVEVNQGVVTLTGKADTWQDFQRAEVDAYAAGARQVKNLLTVRHP